MPAPWSTPELTAGPFFVLRAPLCSLAQLAALAPPVHAGELDAVQPVELRRQVRTIMRAMVREPALREAIRVASPSLFAALPGWEACDAERHPADHAVTAYLYRSATRPTPFGLFAGWALGRCGPATRLELDGRDTWRRHTRLDGAHLRDVVDRIVGDPALAEVLRYRPNDTLYRVGDQLRYLELGRGQAPRLAAVEASDAVALVLERARGGATLPVLAGALAAALATDPGELSDARTFVAELAAADLVRPELGVAVTGDEPARDLITQLEAIPGAAPLARALDDAITELARLDAAPLGSAPERYDAVAARLATATGVAAAQPFQVDLRLAGRALALGPDVIAELTDAVLALHRLGMGTPPRGLAVFQDRFAARYGTRAAPLLEVFDPELGVDYPFGPDTDGVPVLAGLPFAAPAEPRTFDHRHAGLLARVVDAAHAELVLTDRDLDELAATEVDPLPDAFAVKLAILGAGEADRRLVFKGACGPSSALLLGRFCHGDAALTAAVRDHLAREEDHAPGAVFAEIVYRGQDRLTNVVSRPVLRRYEIVVDGRSGIADDRQLPLSDLSIAIRGGRIVVLSTRLGREVVPRLAAAHGFARPENLAIYHFLGALQRQRVAHTLRWDWGPLDAAPRLPRVVRGRTVLAPAQWRLGADELRGLTGPAAARPRHARALRARRQLPRYACLADDDQLFAVDLESELSLEAFARCLRGRGSAVLHELFYDAHASAVVGVDGGYANELVVPFARPARPARPAAVTSRPARTPAIIESFRPGSEWLYLKLYTRPRAAAHVLARLVPVVRAAEADAAIDRWFYLYERDPAFQIRLRLHGRPDAVRRVLAELGPALDRLRDDGQVSRIQLDTYVRELARYGGPAGIELAERLFHADSVAAFELTELLRASGASSRAWLVAALGVDALLAASRLDGEARHALLVRISDAYHREHATTPALRHGLGERYRAVGPELAAWLAGTADDPVARGAHVIWRRSAPRVAEVLGALDDAAARGALHGDVAQILPSLSHLRSSRLLPHALRETELVLYDFLRRHQRSRLARARSSTATTGGPDDQEDLECRTKSCS